MEYYGQNKQREYNTWKENEERAIMDRERKPYIEDLLRKHLTLIASYRLEKNIPQWAPGAVPL